MGRRLNDKLPRVAIPTDRVTEAHWQQLLRERDARAKLRQKEYADSKRSAEYSDIGEGDRILLNKSRDNKLSPSFEPLPYKVVEKKGNAVLIQDQEGNTKMRNASHMKKFIHPDPSTETHGTRERKETSITTQSEAAVLSPSSHVDEHLPLPSESSPSAPPSRPVRARQPPAWMKDFVSLCAC